MRRHMHTATYRTVCYGWRVGIVKSIVIVIATAAPDCDVNPSSLPNRMRNTHKTSVFRRKNGGTVEGRLRRRSLFGLQSRICVLPWCSPNSSKQYYFRHIAPKTAPYEANGGTNSDFITMLCKNNGIISFSFGKLTFLGGHELTLPPKFCIFEVQNCTLNHSRG